MTNNQLNEQVRAMLHGVCKIQGGKVLIAHKKQWRPGYLRAQWLLVSRGRKRIPAEESAFLVTVEDRPDQGFEIVDVFQFAAGELDGRKSIYITERIGSGEGVKPDWVASHRFTPTSSAGSHVLFE